MNMKRTLFEDIERMNQITKYIIPKTIERDEDDVRNKPLKEIPYRGYIIQKNWLGMYSTNVGGDTYMGNKEWKAKEFIDEKINENPQLKIDNDQEI